MTLGSIYSGVYKNAIFLRWKRHAVSTYVVQTVNTVLTVCLTITPITQTLTGMEFVSIFTQSALIKVNIYQYEMPVRLKFSQLEVFLLYIQSDGFKPGNKGARSEGFMLLCNLLTLKRCRCIISIFCTEMEKKIDTLCDSAGYFLLVHYRHLSL